MQRDDCQSCLESGLKFIGINPNPDAAIDFGAINSDDLCISMAHCIEACLDAKGYFVAPLSVGFLQCRAAGTVVPFNSAVDAIVTQSHPKAAS